MKWTLFSIALGLLAWAGFALAAAPGEPADRLHEPAGPPERPVVVEVPAPSPLPAVGASSPADPADRALQDLDEVPSAPPDPAQEARTRLDDARAPELHRIFSRAMPLQGRTPPPEIVP